MSRQVRRLRLVRGAGPRAYLYLDADYRQHILSGILIAAGRQAASCAVNDKPAEVPAYREPELIGCENQLLP